MKSGQELTEAVEGCCLLACSLELTRPAFLSAHGFITLERQTKSSWSFTCCPPHVTLQLSHVSLFSSVSMNLQVVKILQKTWKLQKRGHLSKGSHASQFPFRLYKTSEVFSFLLFIFLPQSPSPLYKHLAVISLSLRSVPLTLNLPTD